MRRAQSIGARQCAEFRCTMWFCAPRRRIECQRSALKVMNSNKRKEKWGSQALVLRLSSHLVRAPCATLPKAAS